MADFDEGLAIGLVLGRKKGGGGNRSDVFHDILDNSEAWIEARIDSKFKYTASLWYTERFELYDSGYLNYVNGFDSDNTTVYEMLPIECRKNVYCTLVAWENNVPLFAKIYDWNSYSQMRDSYLHVDWIDNGITKPYHFFTPIYSFIRNSAAFADENIYLNFNGTFSHSIHVPSFSFQCNKKTYKSRYGTSSEHFPEPVLDTDETVTISPDWQFPTNIVTMPDYNGTFSDISYSEVISKYSEIVQAIYAANGVTLRNSYLPVP